MCGGAAVFGVRMDDDIALDQSLDVADDALLS